MSKWTEAINTYYKAQAAHRRTIVKVAEAKEALKEAQRAEDVAFAKVVATQHEAYKEMP